MELLINRVDIAQYRQISETVYEDVLNQFIQEAQFMDIQDLMGADFYNDLLLNYSDAKYTTLLDGGSYTYSSKTYTNVGLKTVLVYYSYARYVRFGSSVDTPFSFVEKTTEDSTPVSESTKKAIYKNNQQIAFKYWMNVKSYLDRNSSTYPLWGGTCYSSEREFKISKII